MEEAIRAIPLPYDRYVVERDARSRRARAEYERQTGRRQDRGMSSPQHAGQKTSSAEPSKMGRS